MAPNDVINIHIALGRKQFPTPANGKEPVKRPHTLRFYLYTMSRIEKFIEMKNRLVVV